MSKLPNLTQDSDDAEQLLADAEEAFPDSDFVASVRGWYAEHGFLTEKQEEVLNDIIERGP